MATERVDVGSLGINVEANVAEFERDSGRRLKESSERIGREAGQSMGRAVNSGISSTAAEQQALAAQNGREAARAQVRALEQQFRMDQARIKEGLLRGFISPDEAMRAGREAAQAYNDGVTTVLDMGARTGAFRGSRGRELFVDITDSIKNVDRESRLAGAGLGQLRQSLASVAAQAAGVNPVFGRLVNAIGSLGMGSVVMVGALAGLAALGFAWNKITEASREAKEQAEKGLALLERLLEKQRLGATGAVEMAIREGNRALEEAHRALERADRIGVTPRRRRELIDTINELKAQVAAGEEELTRIQTEQAEEAERERERLRQERLRADEAMFGESRRLMEQWQTSRMTELERLIVQLGRYAEAAEKLGQLDIAADLRRQRQEYELQLRAIKEWQQVADQILADRPRAQLAAGSRGSADFRVSGMEMGLRPEAPTFELHRIQEDLQDAIARLKILRAQGAITEQELHDRTAEEARKANQRILELLKQYERMGMVGPEVVRMIAAALKETKGELDDTAAKVQDLADAFIAVGRGVLNTADALGLLDDRSRRAINGLIGAAEAAKSIATGNVFGGVIQGIGAVAQLGAAIFGKSPAQKERDEIMRQNNQALERLALEISGFTVSMDVIRRLIEHGASSFSAAELDAIAQRYNITIRDRDGRLIQDAIRQLQEAARADMAAGGIIARGGAGQPRLNVSMTVVQGNRLVDLASAQLNELRGIRAAIAGPLVTSAGVSSVTRGGDINISQVSVVLEAGENVTPRNAETVGQRIGQGMRRGLSDRMHDAHAAAGRKGGLTIPVRS